MRCVSRVCERFGFLISLASLLCLAHAEATSRMAEASEQDLRNGRTMFFAGGCASCHAAPASQSCDDPKIGDRFKLAGGRCLKTPFGTFNVPNISPDTGHGIGGWTQAQFVTAMRKGLSPEGEHYYPAFPYTSYQRMREQDLIDLKAFLDSLPPVQSRVPPHELALPYRSRATLAAWKWLYLDGRVFTPDPSRSDKLNRGAYLVEGPGHCGECHSPRDFLGGVKADRKYSGAPDPEGKGIVPNITPHKTGIGDWSEADIVTALETGFTPSFDTFGGNMVKVQENMAELSAGDREAIAAYLKSLPAIPSSVGKPKKSGNGEKAGKP